MKHEQKPSTELSRSESRLKADILAVKQSTLKAVYHRVLAFQFSWFAGAIVSGILASFITPPALAAGIAGSVGIVLGVIRLSLLPRNIEPEVRQFPGESGFTMVELLAVTGIIAVLATVAILSIQGGAQGAFEAKVKADLKKVNAAFSAAKAAGVAWGPTETDCPANSPTDALILVSALGHSFKDPETSQILGPFLLGYGDGSQLEYLRDAGQPQEEWSDSGYNVLPGGFITGGYLGAVAGVAMEHAPWDGGYFDLIYEPGEGLYYRDSASGRTIK
jgi:prepilin-type N-terminal cleavage/methylation domain-containing protein